MTHQTVSPAALHAETVRLLACGAVAGPLFLAVLMIQAFTREGFDLSRHPLSLLSLGNLGWIQIANFVVTGALMVACATGMRRVLRPGPRAGADQLARHPARGRIRAGVPRDDRRVSGVRVTFRGPQAPELGRSLRRDGGGSPVLASWPDTDDVSVRLVIASAILFAFVAATAARLVRGLPVAAETSAAAGSTHVLQSAA
jgi:Protein of unknown function (DUF998)